MVKVFLTLSIVWTLFLGCESASLQSPQSEEKKTPALPTIKLTNEKPTGAFVVNTDSIAPAADVLEISVARVVNPAQTPVTVFVYVSDGSVKDGEEAEKIPVGSFSLYPADRPGNFLLPAPSRKSHPKNIKIVLELKRTDETKAWTDVEVEVRLPKWRSDAKK